MTEQQLYILKKLFDQNNDKVNGMKLKLWFKNEHPEIKEALQQLLSQYPNLITISNVIGCLIHDIPFDSFKCKACGKILNIKNWTQPKTYCSTKCAANDTQFQQRRSETISKDPDYWKKRNEKTKITSLEKYGTQSPNQAESVKQKIKESTLKDPDVYIKRTAKTQKTLMEKFGVINVGQLQNVKEKVKQTNLQRYGVQHPSQNPQFVEKAKQTCLQKYGVDNPMKLKENIRVSTDKSWKKILSWSEYVTPLFSYQEYTGYSHNQIYKWKCSKCGYQFEQQLYHTKISSLSQFIPRCPKCFPIKVGSYKQIELFNFIKTYFENVECRNRQLINPYELDVVIPEKKVALQFNGIYWHSDERKNDKNHHLNKTLSCEKTGYKLIHIWEYDWLNPIKQNILKEKIKAILGVDQTKIYARKCQIKQIDSKIKNNFLNKHHIQGEDKSLIKLGLFYQDELIAVMTFGKPRFNKKYEYELIRYATKSGYHVLGGAGKLLKYFQKTYKPKSVITYADRCYSQGNMYRMIGFNELKPSGPGYVWTNGIITLSRYQCQKHKLKSILKDKFDQNLTETQNMMLNGYLKIYDCGNLIFQKIY